MKQIVLFIALLFSIQLFAQDVFVHHQNTEIYAFLDEMASLHYIKINDLIKPFSRKEIASKLAILEKQSDFLNARQKEELFFYLKDYNKELKPTKRAFKKRLDLFFYKDSLFSFTVNPIGGIHYFSSDSGSVFHRWNGAEAYATVGENWGFYASLRDNHESKLISKEVHLNQRIGANYKYNGEGGDYSEMRGGLTYAWKWGSFGLIKDNPQWGYAYNGTAILSGKTPSYPHIYLKMKPVEWFQFNYMHAWLISEIIDSTESFYYTNSYGSDRRDLMHNKFFAANMFTFTILKETKLSFGNSIVYNSDQVQAAYLNPLMFYKSVDHTLNATDQAGRNVGQNSQMFFAFSTRYLKHLHLYATFFLDEIAISRITDPENHSNFYSLKTGFKLSSLIPNTDFNVEYTKTNPLTFQHNIPVTTFESNGYNLGHYLKDNAEEIYISISYRPFRGLLIKTSYLNAKKGPDYTLLGTSRLGLPFMESIEWKYQRFELKTLYQVINDGFLFASYSFNSTSGPMLERYSPEYLQGKNHSISFGLNFGF